MGGLVGAGRGGAGVDQFCHVLFIDHFVTF